MVENDKLNSDISDNEQDKTPQTQSNAYQNSTYQNTPSQVNTAPNRKRVYMILIVVFLLLLLYFWVSVRSEKYVALKSDKIGNNANNITPDNEEIEKLREVDNISHRNLPNLPEIEKVDFPDAPPPPVIDFESAKIEDNSNKFSQKPTIEISDLSQEERAAKMSANIVVFSGGGSDAEKNENGENRSSFLGFAEGGMKNSNIKQSSSPSVSASVLSNLDKTILQGKVIDAVLETAINTELPGSLRAVITRDVYGEQGKNVLIPKGSRVIGSYSSDVASGKERVFIMWSRIITPSGLDINVMSPATDQLGRAGLSGKYNDKFFSKLGNAFLVSYITPVVANKISQSLRAKNDPIKITEGTSDINNLTTLTKTGDIEGLLMYDAAKKFVDISSKTLSDKFNLSPNITIQQGTKITILVARDLKFY